MSQIMLSLGALFRLVGDFIDVVFLIGFDGKIFCVGHPQI
jgi:hypothetical protein